MSNEVTAKPATIYDVARAARVSHQSVALYLRGHTGFRAGTRERVERSTTPSGLASLVERLLTRIDPGTVGEPASPHEPEPVVRASTAAPRRRA